MTRPNIDSVPGSAWSASTLGKNRIPVRWLQLISQSSSSQSSIGLLTDGTWVAVTQSGARPLREWESAMQALLERPRTDVALDLAIAAAGLGLAGHDVVGHFPWHEVVLSGLRSADEYWGMRALDWIDRSERNEQLVGLLVSIARGQEPAGSPEIRRGSHQRAIFIAEAILLDAIRLLGSMGVGQLTWQNMFANKPGPDLVIVPASGPRTSKPHVVEIEAFPPPGPSKAAVRALTEKIQAVRRANPSAVKVGLLVVLGLTEEEAATLGHSNEFCLLGSSLDSRTLAESLKSWSTG